MQRKVELFQLEAVRVNYIFRLERWITYQVSIDTSILSNSCFVENNTKSAMYEYLSSTICSSIFDFFVTLEYFIFIHSTHFEIRQDLQNVFIREKS